MKKVGRVTVFLSKIDVNFADLNRGQLAKREWRRMRNALPEVGGGIRQGASGYENADSRRGQQIYLPAFLAALSAASISLLF